MAKYDLSKPMRRSQFERRVQTLKEKGRFVELKELTARSLRQNNYQPLDIPLGRPARYPGEAEKY